MDSFSKDIVQRVDLTNQVADTLTGEEPTGSADPTEKFDNTTTGQAKTPPRPKLPAYVHPH